jgi:hypothetical protein
VPSPAPLFAFWRLRVAHDADQRIREAKEAEKLDVALSMKLDDVVTRATGKLSEEDVEVIRRASDRLGGLINRRCPQCGFER